jgi:hypothetical protein
MSNDILAELDARLKQQSHGFWGWVVYRCTYISDSEWLAFTDKLESMSRWALEDYAATDEMFRQHVWTFVEDRERLENASKSDVRRIFNEWVNGPEAAAEQPNARVSPPENCMARYNCCIYVDEASLRSVLGDNKSDDSNEQHLNLIDRSWIPEEEEEEPDEGDSYDDFVEELAEEQRETQRLAALWPEVEGCTEEDIGWCKVVPCGVVVDRYLTLCDQSSWWMWYTRPPKLAR